MEKYEEKKCANAKKNIEFFCKSFKSIQKHQCQVSAKHLALIKKNMNIINLHFFTHIT